MNGNSLTKIDSLGLECQLSIGFGGLAGLDLGGFDAIRGGGPIGGFGSASVGLVITSGGQIGIQGAVGGGRGYGAFVGAGVQGGLTFGGSPTNTGFSTQRYAQIDANAGYGTSYGLTVQAPIGDGLDNKGVTLQTGLGGPLARYGVGVGGQVSVGGSIQATYVTKSFDTMRRILSPICGS